MQATRGCAYPVFKNRNFGSWERWIPEAGGEDDHLEDGVLQLRNKRWGVSMKVAVHLVWSPVLVVGE